MPVPVLFVPALSRYPFTYAMASTTRQTDMAEGTLFWAYNAIAGYYQNVKDCKTEDDKLNSI